MASSCCLWGACLGNSSESFITDLFPSVMRGRSCRWNSALCQRRGDWKHRFVNDILELRILFSELMEVMSKDHYEQSPGSEHVVLLSRIMSPAATAGQNTSRRLGVHSADRGAAQASYSREHSLFPPCFASKLGTPQGLQFGPTGRIVRCYPSRCSVRDLLRWQGKAQALRILPCSRSK